MSKNKTIAPGSRAHRVSSVLASIIKTEDRTTGCGEQPPPDVDDDKDKTARIFDPQAFAAVLDEDEAWDDGGYVGPDDERPRAPPTTRTVEGEVWARVMRKIVADPQDGYRRLLIGDEAMASRLRQATATTPHFAAVVGIIERAVLTSARTGVFVRFPPILMLSEPGLGKTYFARAVATALGTSAFPIALNATSDQGQLGGLSQSWRGAKLGQLAKAIIFDCETASPLFLLDEIDKIRNHAGGDSENLSAIFLSALEPENARAYVDQYTGDDLPIRMDKALWLASANTLDTISPPLLSRLLVVEVPKPSEDQARVIIRAIAKAAVDCAIADEAVDLMLAISPRKARQAIELAYPFMVCAGRESISADDMRRALELVDGSNRRHVIGFTR